MKLKTLAEVMAELPEERRRNIEARAQELIAEEETRRAKRREKAHLHGGADDDAVPDAPIDIEDAEPLAHAATSSD